MTAKQFAVEMFSSSEGISHKRILGAIGFLALVVFMFVSCNDRVVEAVEFCTIAYGLGTVAEKFSNRYGKSGEN